VAEEGPGLCLYAATVRRWRPATRDPRPGAGWRCSSVVRRLRPAAPVALAFALIYDVLRRYLAFCGCSDRHVSNITDIEDKLIERAKVERRRVRFASTYEGRWWEAMDALEVERPIVSSHATEYVRWWLSSPS